MSDSSLLPFNASELEKTLEATMCCASKIPVPIDILWNATTCPENLLPWLAWALSVDTWDSTWPEIIKRQVIADSVHVHRIKGTLASVRRVLNGLNIQADISEWFEHGGPPHTFQLTAWTDDQVIGGGAPILNGALYRNLISAVDNVKPVRSHYDFSVGVRFNAEFQLGSSSYTILYARNWVIPEVAVDMRARIVIPTQVLMMSMVRVSAVFL